MGGINYTLNWDEDPDIEIWAKLVVLISGYFFSILTLIGSFMLLVWAKPKTGALIVSITAFIAGTARFIATILGFQDYWLETYLDSTSAGTTDVAIFAFQIYLMVDAVIIRRMASREEKGYKAVPSHVDEEKDNDVINEETELQGNESGQQETLNPFNKATIGSAYN